MKGLKLVPFGLARIFHKLSSRSREECGYYRLKPSASGGGPADGVSRHIAALPCPKVFVPQICGKL